MVTNGYTDATITPMGWQELAGAVINRRVELGMRTRKQLADATGMTVKTLGEIERAERTSYDPATLARVEQVLQWEPGTINGLVSQRPEPIRANFAADLPPDAHPALAELAQLLNSPLPADARATLLADLERVMATARREAADLPAVGHASDVVAYTSGGKIYMQAKPFHGTIDSVATALVAFTDEGSSIDPSARAALRDNMVALYRIGLALLNATPDSDGHPAGQEDFPPPQVSDRPTSDAPTVPAR